MGQSQVATGEKPHTLERSVREGGEEGRGDEGRQQKRGADRTADANITPCSVSSKSQVGATHHWARAWILIIRAGFFFLFPQLLLQPTRVTKGFGAPENSCLSTCCFPALQQVRHPQTQRSGL